jgi:DNA-binding helix-hairpin-helix protein with protein kinase domain
MKTVFDEQGVAYALTRSLGRGGQGEVWLTADGRRVVKRLFQKTDAERVRRQIAYVRRLDLTGLHVARPIALLRPPAVGYVAEFLGDMEPFGNLLGPPRGVPLTNWYLTTGGLRRRLRLLAHVGEMVSALHARGLAYGDLSPANVFVSKGDGHTEAWLIDLDNLHHASDPARTVTTRGYTAPELLDGRRGMTSLSDAWAFATLVVHALRLVHPFFGDVVEAGEPELEDEAFAARLPWIEHEADRQNQSSRGLPAKSVLTKGLFELARRTFEPEGHPARERPGVGAWVERLHDAADRTRRCGGCEGTCYMTRRTCPWCDHPDEGTVHVEIHRWEPGRGLAVGALPVGVIALSARESRTLDARLCEAETGLVGRALRGVLSARERGVFALPEAMVRWFTSAPDDTRGERAREVSARGVTLPVEPTGWRLHFGPMDKPHRVAVLAEVRHARA